MGIRSLYRANLLDEKPAVVVGRVNLCVWGGGSLFRVGSESYHAPEGLCWGEGSMMRFSCPGASWGGGGGCCRLGRRVSVLISARPSLFLSLFFLNTGGILREFKRIPGKGLQTSLSDMVEGPCLERSFLETVGRWGWGWGRMGIAGEAYLVLAAPTPWSEPSGRPTCALT